MEKQRNMFQMKAQNKASEKHLNKIRDNKNTLTNKR